MTAIVLSSEFQVDLVDHAGSDEMICRAARVSTIGAASAGTLESQGLIGFLLKNRHGSPFEHSMMTFRIVAPIFVWREFMRHRIGFSYNEESGRYKQLDPLFYIPPKGRALVQEGKPGEYNFVEGTLLQYSTTYCGLKRAYQAAWDEYERLLEEDVAKEVARMCLPVSIYSTAYVTCNPRSLMNFLSLRVKDENAMFKSFPMWEINQVALKMEGYFSNLFPMTYHAYINHGRVAP